MILRYVIFFVSTRIGMRSVTRIVFPFSSFCSCLVANEEEGMWYLGSSTTSFLPSEWTIVRRTIVYFIGSTSSLITSRTGVVFLGFWPSESVTYFLYNFSCVFLTVSFSRVMILSPLSRWLTFFTLGSKSAKCVIRRGLTWFVFWTFMVLPSFIFSSTSTTRFAFSRVNSTDGSSVVFSSTTLTFPVGRTSHNELFLRVFTTRRGRVINLPYVVPSSSFSSSNSFSGASFSGTSSYGYTVSVFSKTVSSPFGLRTTLVTNTFSMKIGLSETLRPTLVICKSDVVTCSSGISSSTSFREPSGKMMIFRIIRLVFTVLFGRFTNT